MLRRGGSFPSAILVAGMLGAGCRAGPSPEELPPQAEPGPGGSTEALSWTEDLDALVFSPTGYGPGGSQPPSTAASLMGRAARLIEADRMEDACPLLVEATELAEAGERWIPQRALADLLLATGRDREAAEIYEDLLREGAMPPSAAVWGNLAVARLRAGDRAGARTASEAGLRLDPASPDVKKTLGIIDIQDGRTAEGRALLESSLRSGKSIPEAELALAELEEREGNLERALEGYRRLVLEFDRERDRDLYRRWRGLFRPLDVETGVEIHRRVRAIEAAMEGGARAGGSRGAPESQRESRSKGEGEGS